MNQNEFKTGGYCPYCLHASNECTCYDITIPIETDEVSSNIKRSKLYNDILEIVKKIPREKVVGDAPDASSIAYELEQYFISKQENTELLNVKQMAKVTLMINNVSREAYIQGGGLISEYKIWWKKRNNLNLNLL